MADPNPDDALESNIAAEMKHEYDLFKQKLSRHVLDYANPSIEKLMADIVGSDLL